MTVPSRPDIQAAADRIAAYVRRTPVLDEGSVVLKLEFLQHAGSFKPRGAFNSVLSPGRRPIRLVAASGGNHGLAVAHVGARLGIETDIFVPVIASPMKVTAIATLGARIHQGGANFAEALAASQAWADAPDALVVHAYNGLPTLAGQGTIALELSAQAPDLDVLFIATGGGGLLGGIAAWYAGSPVQLVAVEPAECPSMHRALVAGEPVASPVGGLSADSLGATQVGQDGFDAARRAHVRSVLVSEEEIAQARRLLWRNYRMAVEPGGAVAYAGWRAAAASGDLDGRRAGVIVCGANADPSDLA